MANILPDFHSLLEMKSLWVLYASVFNVVRFI